jgi:hypothetical protein
MIHLVDLLEKVSTPLKKKEESNDPSLESIRKSVHATQEKRTEQ